jgi:hypothetical protein
MFSSPEECYLLATVGLIFANIPSNFLQNVYSQIFKNKLHTSKNGFHMSSSMKFIYPACFTMLITEPRMWSDKKANK